MNVLLINDSSSNPNWGDRAAAMALIRMISEQSACNLDLISEEELGNSAFTDNPNTGQYERPSRKSLPERAATFLLPPALLALNQSLTRRWRPSHSEDIIPHSWEQFESRLQHILSHQNSYSVLLNRVLHADLLIIHGDGCMTGRGRIPRAELFITYLAKKAFHKPVVILNHTADLTDPVLRTMAQHIYPLFDDVVFREHISLHNNRNLCSGRFAPDSAYYFKPTSKTIWLPISTRLGYFNVWPDIANFRPDEPYICIGGSAAFFYRKDYDPVPGFLNLVHHVQSIYSGQIVLTISDLRDQEIFRIIGKRLNLPAIGLATPVQQAVDILGNAEAYIGGRWHPSIFAVRGGTPVICMSTNTFKMQAIADIPALSGRVFDAMNLEAEKEQIGQYLKTYLSQGEALRARLAAWAANEFERSWDNLRYLRALCNTHSSH